MKIEPSKTTQAEKRNAPSDKPETTFQTLFNQTEKLDSSPPPARFAKILEEARNQNAKDKDFLSGRKTERDGQNPETAETRKDEETGGTIHNQEKVEEENEQRGGDESEQSDEQNENSSFALLGLQAAIKPASETTVPAARSILHVADLERIVATVRTQNLKNVEQLVIALKHSVLEGLQIKLTIDKNGTLKAEFLALNEQIKNHLNARRQEITQIFHERGIKLSDLNVRQGSKFAHQTNQSEDGFVPDKGSGGEKINGATETEDFGDQTSYRI